MLNYIINTAGIVLFLDNRLLKFAKDSRQYAAIVEAFDLPASEQEAAVRLAVSNKIIPSEITIGFTITDDAVTFQGETLPKVLADKVRAMRSEGLPLGLFEKFWQNLKENPSSSSVVELYDFLAYKELPITEDGCFLAYKGVFSDFWSINGNLETQVIKGQVNDRGQIYNGVGEDIEVKRNHVDDNRANHCSHGLHVGSLAYATDFAQGAVVVVKVNPKDVVSVPSDYNCQKCRVAAYKVMSVFEKEIVAPVVDEQAKPVKSAVAKKRSAFVERVEAYLDKCKRNGLDEVSVRKVQNSFSPDYPSKQRVLDALMALGYFWNKQDDVDVVDLTD